MRLLLIVIASFSRRLDFLDLIESLFLGVLDVILKGIACFHSLSDISLLI